MVLCYAGQDSYLFFVSLDEVLCPFLKFHFWECVVNKVLRVASLHKMLFKCDNLFVVRCLGASPLTKAMITWPRNRIPQHVEMSIFPKVCLSHSSCSSALIPFVFWKLPVTFAYICLISFSIFPAFERYVTQYSIIHYRFIITKFGTYKIWCTTARS